MQRSKSERMIRSVKLTWQLYVMIAVPFALVILFNYVPMYGIQIAFKNYRPTLGFSKSEWVGLRYFERFVRSSQFVRYTLNTMLINLYGMIFSFPIPIIFALALNYVKIPRYKRFVQTVTYAPHFISTVVIVGILKQMLNPSYGVVNAVITRFGGAKINFLGDPSLFRTLYIGSGVWQNMGWSSIIFLSALSAIDPELHDAAKMDGANILRRIWHIDIPGILPTIVILLIMSFGSFMSVGFEKVYLMQNDMNLSVSETINTYVYKVGMNNGNYSFGTAIGLFQSVIGFILIVMVNYLSKWLSDVSLW
jgi:putative aldouronate transport system permease protein